MSAAPPQLVAPGSFGYVSLLDGQRHAIEFECLVLEVSGEGTAVIGTPGSALLTDTGEWIEVRADAISERKGKDTAPQLAVDGWDFPVVLKRVSHQAIASVPLGQSELRKFTTGDMVVARPPTRATLAAFFGQEEMVTASETDAGASLRLENQRLRAALRAAQDAGGPSASSHSVAAKVPPPAYIGDEGGSEEEGDGSEADDIFSGLMSVPMRPLPKGRADRRAGRGLRRAAFADPEGAGAGSRLEAEAAQSDPQVVQTRLMMEMLKMLQERSGGGAGDTRDLDAPDGQELDGVRVLRTLSRMRALKAQLRSDPGRICREYSQRWEEDLGAHGKPWRWIDVNQKINFGKFNSMRRVHAMLCHILEADQAAESRDDHMYVRALMVQCLKALHEFAQQGDWRTAWPLTHMPDPIQHSSLGGTEVEMEIVLSVLKTKEDLKARTKAARAKTGAELVSDNEEEKPEKEKAGGRRKKKE